MVLVVMVVYVRLEVTSVTLCMVRLARWKTAVGTEGQCDTMPLQVLAYVVPLVTYTTITTK